MAPQEPPTEVRISVKVPAGYLTSTSDDNSSNAETFSLGSPIPISSTIGALRAQIQQLVPTHPSPDRQRLLYSGHHLVDNGQSIGDALNVRRDPTQTEYVIHLVIKGDQAHASTSAGGLGRSSNVGVRREAGPTPTPTVNPGAPGQQQEQSTNVVPQGGQTQHAQANAHSQAHVAQVRQLQQQLHLQQQHLAMHQMQRGIFPLPPGVPTPPNAGRQPPATSPFTQATGPFQPPPWNHMVAQNQQMRAGNGMQGVGPQQPQQEQQSGAQDPAQRNANDGQVPNTHPAGQSQPPSTTPMAGPQPQQFQSQSLPRRPPSGQNFHFDGVTPTGERVQIHHHTINLPFAPNAGPLPFPGRPGNMPILPTGLQFPGLPHPRPVQPNGPSALDRARENMSEMQRMLEEMRNQSSISDEQRRLVQEIQQRSQNLNEYIDPFARLNAGHPNPTSLPAHLRPMQQQARPPVASPHPRTFAQPPSNPNDVTAYLLSGPQGPQALLLSPQYGAYTGTVANNAVTHLPTPTVPPNPEQPNQQQQVAVGPQANLAEPPNPQQVQALAQPPAAAQQDALQPILAHFWFLLRVLIFAYFLLGSNMGWQRPLILVVIGLGLLAFRAGVLAEGGAVRQWWDGVVGIEPAQRQQQQQQPAPGHEAQDAARHQPGNADPANGRGRPFPTPEQVAERLLNQQQARQQEQRARWREMVRPVERAVALFVASLWPGVGEATVRARREADERRRLEEEVERRRREEEEKAREDAKEKEKEKEGERAAATSEQVKDREKTDGEGVESAVVASSSS